MSRCYEGPAIRAIYKQLVNDFGGYDAAAAFLECSKGTISKEISGAMSANIAHICALEDALGRWPVTDMLAGRVERNDDADDLAKTLQGLMKEVGDIGPAIVEFMQTGDAAALGKEAREAVDVLTTALSQIEGAHL